MNGQANRHASGTTALEVAWGAAWVSSSAVSVRRRPQFDIRAPPNLGEDNVSTEQDQSPQPDRPPLEAGKGFERMYAETIARKERHSDPANSGPFWRGRSEVK